ncbi:hypothetical protein D3C84_920300 [compost metagenome]
MHADRLRQLVQLERLLERALQHILNRLDRMMLPLLKRLLLIQLRGDRHRSSSDNFLQHLLKPSLIDRLQQVVLNAAAKRRSRIFELFESAKHDNVYRRAGLPNALNQLNTVHERHLDIRNDKIQPLSAQLVKMLPSHNPVIIGTDHFNTGVQLR